MMMSEGLSREKEKGRKEEFTTLAIFCFVHCFAFIVDEI